MSVLDIHHDFFKPHTIAYLVASDGYEDDNGDYHPGESTYEGCIPCDAVPAGKAETREFEDGKVKAYTYTVYLPHGCRTFTIGERVRITLLGGVQREFEVKGFHRYQLQCKLWV